MAFDVFSAFRKNPLRFSAMAVSGLLLTATTTHAGFEWVPAPRKQQEAMPSAPAAPAPAVEQAMPGQDALTPADQALAPMPGLEEPRQEVLVAPAQPAPVIKSKSFVQPQSPAPNGIPLAPLNAPPVMAAQPTPATPNPAEAAAAQATFDGQRQPAMPAEQAPKAPMARTNIIMPDDAPASAREHLPSDSKPMPIAPQEMSAPANENNEDLSVPPAAEVLPEERVSVPDAPAPTATPAVSAAPAPANNIPAEAPSAPAFAVIEGFGNDMPLALALKEIVPDGYAYSFGIGVDPGALVSWSGGKPWTEVVKDMVAPLGLNADINGNVIAVRSGKQSANTAPSGVEPASGKQEEMSVDMNTIRRQIINDPGNAPAKQPPETLDMIKELGLKPEKTAETTPDNKPAGSPQPLLPPETNAAEAPVKTEAQSMEAGEKRALLEAEPTTVPVQIIDTTSAKSDEMEVAVLEVKDVSATKDTAKQTALWEAQKGDSLKRTLDEWSKQANYQVVWESSHDFTIDADILVTGDLQRALKTVFEQGLRSAQPPTMTFIEKSDNGQSGKIVIQDGVTG